MRWMDKMGARKQVQEVCEAEFCHLCTFFRGECGF